MAKLTASHPVLYAPPHEWQDRIHIQSVICEFVIVRRGLFVAMIYFVRSLSGSIVDDGRRNANCLRCDSSISSPSCVRFDSTTNNGIECSKHTVSIFNSLKTFSMQSQSWNNCVVNNVIKITNDIALTHKKEQHDELFWCVIAAMMNQQHPSIIVASSVRRWNSAMGKNSNTHCDIGGKAGQSGREGRQLLFLYDFNL